MKQNIIKEKSFAFAVRMIKLYKHLTHAKKEHIMAKQLLRCGTSVGAMIREAEYAESKSDFVHKMAIAQKELNETCYWLELLVATTFLTQKQFDSINSEAIELLKLTTSIIKTTKANINGK